MSLSTHCIDHITTGQSVVLWVEKTSTYNWSKVLYCKQPTNGKQLQDFLVEVGPISEVGGESVSTLPPWPLLHLLNTQRLKGPD